MRGSAILPVIFIAALVVLNSIYFVYEGEYGIIKRFDEVVAVKHQAGLGIKIPFIENKTSLTKKYVMHDIQQTDVLTLDKRSMIVDTYAVWHIVDPLRFLQTAATIREGERRIENTVYGTLKTTISEINQAEIIESRTGEYNVLNQRILDNARESLGDFGVNLVDVQIKKFDLPESNKNAVFERMISERNQIAARFLAEGEEEAGMIRYAANKEQEIIISQSRAQAARLEGEGESEFMRILAAAYNTTDRAAFYEFLRTLDALRITMRGDTTIVMPGDSALPRTIIGGGQ